MESEPATFFVDLRSLTYVPLLLVGTLSCVKTVPRCIIPGNSSCCTTLLTRTWTAGSGVSPVARLAGSGKFEVAMRRGGGSEEGISRTEYYLGDKPGIDSLHERTDLESSKFVVPIYMLFGSEILVSSEEVRLTDCQVRDSVLQYLELSPNLDFGVR